MLPRFGPYRASPAMPAAGAPASVHECGDIIVHLRVGVGPVAVRLEAKTVDVRYEPRLLDLSIPLFLTALMFAMCEAGAFMLLSRTHRGVPPGALRAVWLPLIVFVIAALGPLDPAARRVHVRGTSRSGDRVAAEVVFASARGAWRFVRAAKEAKAAAEQDVGC